MPIAETGDIARFPSRNHYASYAGTAPLDASRGDIERHRVNPAGSRQLNWAIHIAAIVQIRHDCPGREYYRRKIAAGKGGRAEVQRGLVHLVLASSHRVG